MITREILFSLLLGFVMGAVLRDYISTGKK